MDLAAPHLLSQPFQLTFLADACQICPECSKLSWIPQTFPGFRQCFPVLWILLFFITGTHRHLCFFQDFPDQLLNLALGTDTGNLCQIPAGTDIFILRHDLLPHFHGLQSFCPLSAADHFLTVPEYLPFIRPEQFVHFQPHKSVGSILLHSGIKL